MTRRSIVLDANILIRAVLGQCVRELIIGHAADGASSRPMLRSMKLSSTCLGCWRSEA
jgi:hypothetical protein